jgi:tryptophan 2,3-dioxygenase
MATHEAKSDGTRTRPTTYWDYLRLDELLSLQTGLEQKGAELSNDEVLFISVHQIFELWFQLILRELRSARDLFRQDSVAEQELSGAVRGLRRVGTILQRCTEHWPVIETLQTRDYLDFRDKLTPASGFQSFQLRQIEILMGLREEDRIKLGKETSYKDMLRGPDGEDSLALRRVEAQLSDGPSLKDAIDEWLWRTPIDGLGPGDPGGDQALDRFVAAYLGAPGR